MSRSSCQTWLVSETLWKARRPPFLTAHSDLQEELQRIKSIAADSINLERRNRDLREENQKIRNDLEVLTAENERLEASKEYDFMLLGAGLVLGGVLLALIIPMLKPTRKTDNWA